MQQRSEETRSKILASAVKLFSARGFNAASVDVYLQRRRHQQRRLLSSFESKQALFLALLDGWLQTIDNAIETSKDKIVPETFVQMTEAFPYILKPQAKACPCSGILVAGQSR